jgi:hypothetical protein
VPVSRGGVPNDELAPVPVSGFVVEGALSLVDEEVAPEVELVDGSCAGSEPHNQPPRHSASHRRL